jgi:hypothetical protein
MINRMFKMLTKAIGMKSTCCHTDRYAVIEQNPVCTNPSCDNYLGQTDLKNIFTISFSQHAIKTG